MALFLREADVEKLVTMETALHAVEQAFRMHGEGTAENAPRRRCRLVRGFLHVMSACRRDVGGVKCYTTVAGAARFHGYLYAIDDGRLLSIIVVSKVVQVRTRAACVIASLC